MNILPKKRWHVRTKDNITRVRRDEAEAREKEEKRLEKLKFAESEARINFLRRQTGIPERQYGETDATTSLIAPESQHINLFENFKTQIKKTNKELEREKKAEREKYEKQIGYLTYLGQDTNEALKLKSWYEVAPKRNKILTDNEKEKANEEKDVYNKYNQDPLTLIKALLPRETYTKITKDDLNQNTYNVSTKSTDITIKNENGLSSRTHKKPKKETKSKRSKKKKFKKDGKRDSKRSKSKGYKDKKSVNTDHKAVDAKREETRRDLIERLRQERLEREAAERERQDAFLNPAAVKIEPKKIPIKPSARVVQKYNSQFNPDLAKQNIL